MMAHLIPKRLIPQKLEILERLEGRDGPLRVALPAAPGCQGTRFGAGAVPRGARARRVRWSLLPSGARPAGARCRRQRAVGGNRGADCGFSPSSEERERFSLALYGTSETLKIDGEGRVTLTETLKAHAGITEAVTFVGLGHKFQIWEPGRFQAELAEATEKVRALKRRSARGAGMTGEQRPSYSRARPPRRRVARRAERRALYRRHVRRRRLYARDPRDARRARHRHRSRPKRDRPRRGTGRAGARPARTGRGSVFQSCIDRAATPVDGVVFDLGVSSMQLDEAERGFSFRFDGPLDMRMGRDGPSAADVVARAGERDLAFIIATLGEERHARAVARAIVKARGEHAIATTRALAEIVARVVHAREGANSSGDPHVPGAAHFRQRRACRTGARPRCRRARAQARRPPGRRVLSFARGSHRQDVPEPSAAARRLLRGTSRRSRRRRRPSAC